MIGSLFGWVFEYICRGFHAVYDDNFPVWNKLPLLWMYGAGLTGQWVLYRFICHWPWYFRAIAYAVVFDLFEFTTGYTCMKMENGKKRWDYSDKPLGGLVFIDLRCTIAWIVLGFVSEQLFFKRDWFQKLCGTCTR